MRRLLITVGLYFSLLPLAYSDSITKPYFQIGQDLSIWFQDSACESYTDRCSSWYTLKNGKMDVGYKRHKNNRCQVFFFPSVKFLKSSTLKNQVSFRNITLPEGESFYVEDSGVDLDHQYYWISAKNSKPLHRHDSDTISGVIIECRGKKSLKHLDGWFLFSDQPKSERVRLQ